MLETCKKRARKELSVPVPAVFKGMFIGLYPRGNELVAEMPNYKDMKTRLRRERRKVVGTEQNPQDSSVLVFREKFFVSSTVQAFYVLTTRTNQARGY